MADPVEKEKVSCLQGLKSSCGNLGNFLYSKREVNGVEQTLVMGRNGNSWAKIGLFYVCFYAFLAGFFIALLSVFLSTLNDPQTGGPKLTQFIANQPGLTLINKFDGSYNKTNQKEIDAVNKPIVEFLKIYSKYDGHGKGAKNCNASMVTGYEGAQACIFDYKTALSDKCTESNGYGLKDGQPCLLIKMNKVFDWVPAGDSEFLNLECETGSVISGFLKAAMPFRGQSVYENPIAVVQAPKLNEPVSIRCKLVGEGIKVSDTYNPKRAFGKIEINVPAPKKL